MSRISRPWLVGGSIVGAFVVLNVAIGIVGRYTHDPSGPISSSYATAPAGLAAYADLLARSGHRVDRIRAELSVARLDPDETVVVLDPTSVDLRAARALRRFVDAGGRLVAGGAESSFWLAELLGSRLRWDPVAPTRPRVLAPTSEVAGVAEVESIGQGSWEDLGGALPVLGDGRDTLLAVTTRGRGRVELLADASPLQNRLLAEADDAQLGLALAGPRGRAVAFVESVHGYGRASGVLAIPGSWKWALLGLALAYVVFLWASARRLGPAEREARELAPPRRVYVDSLAAVLARSKHPAEAVAPVQAAIRRRVERGADIDPQELEDALRPPRTERDVLAAGRTLARLDGIGKGPRA
jgi:hypothetical protein